MIKQLLHESFINLTTDNIRFKAERVLKNDLIYNLEVNFKDEYIFVTSVVVSESLFNEYNCTIVIDTKSMNIIKTKCTCDDFEQNMFKKDVYFCKHLAATFYAFSEKIDKDEVLRNNLLMNLKKDNKDVFKAPKTDYLDILLKREQREKLKLDIIIDRNNWSSSIQAELRIGLTNSSSKMYVIKNIREFLDSVNNNYILRFGKNLTYDYKKQYFEYKDRKIIEFITNIRSLDDSNHSFRRYQDRLVDGKYFTIPDMALKEFFSLIRYNRVFLGDGFFTRIVDTEIIEADMDIAFSINEESDNIIMDLSATLPEPLNRGMDVFLFRDSIYIPSYQQCAFIEPYISIFKHNKKLYFDKSSENKVLKELIPRIADSRVKINLSQNLNEKIVRAPVHFKFYFDRVKKIKLIFKVCYNDIELNYFDDYKDKIIFRDNKKEDETFNLIKSYGFTEKNRAFYYAKGDSEAFDFFKYDIKDFQEIGEVYYSARFKGIKQFNKESFTGEIRKGQCNYFEFEFDLMNMNGDIIRKLIEAFRNNIKYFKLPDGEFLDLSNTDLKNSLMLLSNIIDNNNFQNKKILLDKSKALYAEDYLEEKGLRYIESSDELLELKDRFKKVNDVIFPLPDNLKADLRSYQKEGYNYLKTLDFLGFGGILADEMGLGKTVQIISFLLSRKNAKTLIIVPTSLLFNWENEFKKFAEGVKVSVVSGNKSDRRKIIESYEDSDILITSYNLLRIDIDLYDMKFDYCILDEAQNIKNPSSKQTKAVKKIKAELKYALSGTPIENSLMELWSIFDFIMPGYLYSEKKFTMRYYRRLNEDSEILTEVKRLVSPFILRRLKKDVIKELPSKIEKRVYVDLSNKQKVVYKAYTEYVRKMIEKEFDEDDVPRGRIEILSYITKLREICLDPSVVVNDYTGASAKIDALCEILDSSTSENHKILVFSQFTTILKNIAERLKDKEYKFLYLDGNVKSQKRIELVNEFNNNKEYNVFLISLKAGGTGLNLTGADVVIHFDPWWNPAVEDQASDRAHRIGQKHVVEVIKLIAKGTIEEKIISLQDTKKEMASEIIGNESNYGVNILKLKPDEIINLFN